MTNSASVDPIFNEILERYDAKVSSLTAESVSGCIDVLDTLQAAVREDRELPPHKEETWSTHLFHLKSKLKRAAGGPQLLQPSAKEKKGPAKPEPELSALRRQRSNYHYPGSVRSFSASVQSWVSVLTSLPSVSRT